MFTFHEFGPGALKPSTWSAKLLCAEVCFSRVFYSRVLQTMMGLRASVLLADMMLLADVVTEVSLISSVRNAMRVKSGKRGSDTVDH